MAEKCSLKLDELYAELALSRPDKKSKSSAFAYPEDGVVQILDSLLPSIHSRAKDKGEKYLFTSGNEYNYINGSRAEIDTLLQNETITDVQTESSDSSVSVATCVSSTLTLKSDLLGDLRPQILNQDMSFATEFSEGVLKILDDEVYEERIMETASDGIGNIERSKSRKNIYVELNKRNYLNEVGDKRKSKSNIHLSSDLTSRNIFDGANENRLIPSSLSKPPIIPAEKEFTRSPKNSFRMKSALSSNGLLTNQHRVLQKESYSQKRLEETEDAGDLKKSDSSFWAEEQSANSDKDSKEPSGHSAKGRFCKGDIISHFDHYFRCRSSMSFMKRTRSDSTISIVKSLKGMRRSCYFRSHETPTQKTSKLGKPTILWAITKINVYPDNSRTYEVMPLSGKRPAEVPDRSDSVFVLIPPKKNQQRGKTVQE